MIQALAQEVSPASHLTVGGHGALAMQEHFQKSHIDVLEDFAALDEKLEQLKKRLRSTLTKGYLHGTLSNDRIL